MNERNEILVEEERYFREGALVVAVCVLASGLTALSIIGIVIFVLLT